MRRLPFPVVIVMAFAWLVFAIGLLVRLVWWLACRV